MDLGFIFGASGSKADDTFTAQKRFANSMMDKYIISPDATLIGAVTYGRDASVATRFSSGKDKATTVSLINRLQNPKDGSNLKNALEVARDRLFSERYGARRNVPKTAVVFVDTKTSNLPADLSTTAKSLKENGIKIIVIGIGPDTDKKELAALADSEAIFFPESLEEMERQVSPVVQAALPGKILNQTF